MTTRLRNARWDLSHFWHENCFREDKWVQLNVNLCLSLFLLFFFILLLLLSNFPDVWCYSQEVFFVFHIHPSCCLKNRCTRRIHFATVHFLKYSVIVSPLKSTCFIEFFFFFLHRSKTIQILKLEKYSCLSVLISLLHFRVAYSRILPPHC